MLQVPFVFPRKAEESAPMPFVHGGDGTLPVTNKLVVLELVNPEAFRWW